MDLFLMDYYISSIHSLFDNDYEDPINMKILNFDKKYIKCNIDALLYELENYYISYVEKKLVLDDADKS